jgi:hypothetical protein
MTTIKRKDIQNLKFHQGDREYWTTFPKTPEFGIVGNFGADRADDWNRFIVINDNGDKINVIFPRMLLIDDEIVLGKDKISEKYVPSVNCECPLPSQGDDFCCHCGADKEQTREYMSMFESVSDDYEYEIVEFEKPKRNDYVFLQFVPRSHCIEDHPLQGGYCRCCR